VSARIKRSPDRMHPVVARSHPSRRVAARSRRPSTAGIKTSTDPGIPIDLLVLSSSARQARCHGSTPPQIRKRSCSIGAARGRLAVEAQDLGPLRRSCTCSNSRRVAPAFTWICRHGSDTTTALTEFKGGR